MRKSILLSSLLAASMLPHAVLAQEEAVAAEAAAPESNWAFTSNVGFVSDYYFRGVSQSWHRPAIQGGFDVTHSSGFYAGVWGSTISPNTYPDASLEIDYYAGYNGTFGDSEALKDFGWTVGGYGYTYPNGDWDKYVIAGVNQGTKGDFDTFEVNAGLSWKWLSGKVSYTLTDWFGAEESTGFKDDSKGTTYWELNANVPLPWWGLTLVGHVGHLNVSTELDLTVGSSANIANESDPDYTDYKIGLSKSFTLANSEGWNAGVYYVGADDKGYWGKRGFGGASFNNGSEVKDLTDNRWVVTVGRSF
jgi:uncharacterized protein (TIGR02001 family)